MEPAIFKLLFLDLKEIVFIFTNIHFYIINFHGRKTIIFGFCLSDNDY